MKIINILILVLLSTLSCTRYIRDNYDYNSSKNRKLLLPELPYKDPYSSMILSNKSSIEIDHIVPLNVAHSLGAKYWSKKKKKRFANDLENLLAVSKRCNRSKGDKSLGEWLPTNNIQFISTYSNKYLHIIEKYKLD